MKIENYLGIIEVSNEYFANLVGSVVSSCFGVKGMAASGVLQGFKQIFTKREIPDKGVKVTFIDGKLYFDLHIIVTHGINIRTIVKSIINKVSYVVEQATGVTVEAVHVYIDGMNAE